MKPKATRSDLHRRAILKGLAAAERRRETQADVDAMLLDGAKAVSEVMKIPATMRLDKDSIVLAIDGGPEQPIGTLSFSPIGYPIELRWPRTREVSRTRQQLDVSFSNMLASSSTGAAIVAALKDDRP